MGIPRDVTTVLSRRFTITAKGSAAINRMHVGIAKVPLLDLPWRKDTRDEATS